MERHYSFHGLVTMSIHGSNLTSSLGQIDTEYSEFRVSDVNDPDVVINLGQFSPDNDQKVVLDNNYIIGEDYIYISDSYNYGSWEFQVRGFEDEKLIIDIDANTVGRLFITGHVIDPFLFYALGQRGIPAIHSSVVSDQNKGYAFIGPSGCGKTSHAVELLADDFKFHTDDTTLLTDGELYGIPYPINVFNYNAADSIKDAMDLTDRVTYILKKGFGYTTNYQLPTKIALSQFDSFTMDSVEPEKLFLLQRGDDYSIEEISMNDLIRKIIAIQKLDNIYFCKYITEYAFEYPRHSLSNFWNTYESNLKDELPSKAACYSVEIPINRKKQFHKVKSEIGV